MLKKRIIATLVLKDGIVVQSINFKKYLPVGKPSIAMEFLTHWGIDEIILIDISASAQRREPEFKLLFEATKKCFVPLTLGGGITSAEQVSQLLHCGADKVSLNQPLIKKPDLITQIAYIYGKQCVIASIDAVSVNGKYRVYDYLQKKALDVEPHVLAKRAEDLGAGEIVINSVDRDGSYQGYAIDLIQQVCDAVSIPVICSGGAKNAADFVNVFSKTRVSAAAAANFFHFSEHSVNITKSVIEKTLEIRLETHASYHENPIDAQGRLLKKPDAVLEEMLYQRIEKEVI